MIVKKGKLALAVVGVSMIGSQAHAGFTSTPVNYAVESIASNSTVLTIPAASQPVYTVTDSAIGTAGSLTFTLSGATISGAWPATLTCAAGTGSCGTGAAITLSQSSATSATYTVSLTAGAITAGATLSFGAIAITSAYNALGAPAVCQASGPQLNSVQISVAGISGSPSFQPTTSSQSALSYSCNSTTTSINAPIAANTTSINIANGALSFIQATPTANNTATVANIGYYQTSVSSPAPVLTDGATAVTSGLYTTADLSITGNFNGVGNVYIAAAAGAGLCDPAATPVASVAPTASLASFENVANLSSAANGYCVFVQANGTSPMAESQYAIQAGSTGYASGFSAKTTPWVPGNLALISINGSSAHVQYVVGQNSLYNNYVAVTNNSAVPQTLYVYMVTYGLNGPAGVVSGGQYGTIPASGGVLLDSNAIASASGGFLPSGEAAQVYFYSAGPLSASNMVLNAGSIVTGIQSFSTAPNN